MEEPASYSPSIWASLNSWFTPTVFFVLLNLMIGTIVFTANLPAINNQQEQENQNQNPQTAGDQPKIARSPSIIHRLKSFNFHPNRSQQEPSPETHQQQAIEATEFVFNPPLHHQHDYDPTRSDEAAVATAGYDAVSRTHEVQLPAPETHFVWERQQAVETVVNHFGFDPTREGNLEDTSLEDTHEEHEQDFESFDEVYTRLKDGPVNRTQSDTLPTSGEVPVLPEKMKKSASSRSAFSHFEEDEILEARRPATVRERKSAARVEDDVEVDAKADDFINRFKNDLKLQRLDSIIRSKVAASRGTST